MEQKEFNPQSWSLLAFAKLHGKLKVAPFVNKETGEMFKAPVFVDSNNNVTLASFSSKLGELTPAQISADKDNLQIIQLESGSYIMCKTNRTWKDVEL